MHVSKFSLVAVLSCIAMVDATPVGDRTPAEASVSLPYGLGMIGRYVP